MIKRHLIFSLVTIIVCSLFIFDVKASSNDTITFQDGSNTVTLKSPSYYGKQYGMIIKRCYYGCKYYYSIGDTPMGYSTSKSVMSNYDDYNNKTFFIKSGANSDTPFSEFEERIEGLYGINDNSPILWSNYDVPEINWQGDIKESTGNIVHACNADDCIGASLQLKKGFLYHDDNNPMKYIDLYFDSQDFGKSIKFQLNLTSNNMNCLNQEIRGCVDLISGFDISYLVDNKNGLYQWKKLNSNDTNVYVDYEGEQFPHNDTGEGVSLKGKIYLDFDSNIYNFKKIRISFKILNGFDFSYQYSDNSHLSSSDIDNYYHYMLKDSEIRMNRILGGNEKYVLLTSDQEIFSSSLLVEYVNTTKYLYVEYFDTLYSSYIEKGMIISSDNFLIGNRDLEKFNYTIGKRNNRGLYLMNYLYKKDNKNPDSFYYFYLPENLYFSYTNYLNEGIFIDNEGNPSTGVTPNPDLETDNTNVSDSLKPLFENLKNLQATSDFFNNMITQFYNAFPLMAQVTIHFIILGLGALIILKMLGW